VLINISSANPLRATTHGCADICQTFITTLLLSAIRSSMTTPSSKILAPENWKINGHRTSSNTMKREKCSAKCSARIGCHRADRSDRWALTTQSRAAPREDAATAGLISQQGGAKTGSRCRRVCVNKTHRGCSSSRYLKYDGDAKARNL